MNLLAHYYDGRSTKRHAVSLALEGDRLRISGDGIERVAALNEMRVSEPMGSAPRLVTFSDGAYCEVRDHARLQALLRQTGFEDHFVVRWQFSLRWVMASVVLSLGILVAAYLWGLPWVSGQLADELPESVLQAVSKRALESLDGGVLTPSRLPAMRQETLASRFAAMRAPDGNAPPHRLVFRSSRVLRANAIALPSGAIIVTDELVALAENDDQLMGVLAHELGHVHGRHGMRMVMQGTIVGLLAAWFVGDVSNVIAAAPAALLEASYSREFEREADVFAARMLEDNGLSPGCLADILQRIEGGRHGSGMTGKDSGQFSDYLSSHPATAGRIESLRGKPCR